MKSIFNTSAPCGTDGRGLDHQVVAPHQPATDSGRQLIPWLVLVAMLWPALGWAQYPIPCTEVNSGNYQFPSLIQEGICITTGSTGMVTANNNVELKANQAVYLAPGIHANPTGGNFYLAYIEDNGADLVWFEPNTVGQVGQYEKLELGLNFGNEIAFRVQNFVNDIAGDQLNPFDPADIDIKASFGWYDAASEEFVSQGLVHGFYYEKFDRFIASDWENNLSDSKWIEQANEYPFRIRFAPKLLGTWNCIIEAHIDGFGTFQFEPFIFECTTSSNQGFVQTAGRSYRLENGDPYFAIGRNMVFDTWKQSPSNINPPTVFPCTTGYGKDIWCYNYMHPMGYLSFYDEVNRFADGGANFMRFLWFPHTMNLEYEDLGNYSARMHMAWEMDEMLALCKTRDLKMQLCLGWLPAMFDQHLGYRMWDWAANTSCNLNDDLDYCYNSISTVSSPLDFFEDPTAKAFYKRKLRYIVARWGYSTEIASIEFINEIDKSGQYDPDISDCQNSDEMDMVQPYGATLAWQNAINTWTWEMSQELKSLMGHNQHLVTSSYAGKPELPDISWSSPNVDIIDKHTYFDPEPQKPFSKVLFDYGMDLHGVFSNTIVPYTKPYHAGEMSPGKGSGCDQGMEALRYTWKTAFMGMPGTGLHWMYRWDYDTYDHYGLVADRLQGYDLLGWEQTQQQRSDQLVDYMAYRNKFTGHAVGVIDNYTVNYYSLGGTGECTSYVLDPPFSVGMTVYHIPAVPLKIGMTFSVPGKFFLIDFYNGVDGAFVTSALVSSDNNGEIEIPFPPLTDDMTRPMVSFEIRPVSSKQHAEGTEELDESVLEELPPATLFPNPNQGQFTLSLVEPSSIEVRDLMGKLVLQRDNLPSGPSQIDLTAQSQGVYLIRVRGASGQEQHLKVTKQ